ncbi:SMP-30/gluconolactonase/LRE family protein [Kribbella catacumbae]|uniref:SMP-30/gluconolactonase/LRE family protein n=1 Tax=Kribbella catacumbae TaxID=460086 RepID=UPI0003706825|nr:SMP-30/gluconolactonase/LRE family protein [Kribbella catacumbae]
MPKVFIDGLAYGESARWHDGRLWLANWGTGEVLAVDLDGNREVITTVPPETIPFSIDWTPDGQLLVIAGATLFRPEQRLQKTDDELDLSGIGDVFNEIVVDSGGTIFLNGGSSVFTEPGLIAVVTPDGQARQVADGIEVGNGMAITPDDSTLIVAESFGCRLTAFDIAPDGSLTNRRVWADLQDGHPDGICLDAEGAIWYADVPAQRCVRVREGGEVLETIDLDRGVFSCMLGGPDGTTLFMLSAQWRGFEHMLSPERTGLVSTVEVTVPHGGRP